MQEIIKNKIKGLINISNKAGYLIIGSDNLKNYSKKLYLAIVSTNAQNSTQKVVSYIKNNLCCEVFEVETDDMKFITGMDNCKIVGIKNLGLANEIKKYLRGE